MAGRQPVTQSDYSGPPANSGHRCRNSFVQNDLNGYQFPRYVISIELYESMSLQAAVNGSGASSGRGAGSFSFETSLVS